MTLHILNGDSLAENFNLEGEIVVCREALIDGDLRAKNLNELWKFRAEHIKKNYGWDDYFEKVKGEFDKLNHLTPADEVNLWFGNEAFCQVNMWVFLHLLEVKGATAYRVFPDSEGWSCSFNNLQKCFEFRQKLTKVDVQLGKKLWKAFCFQDFESLKKLSETESNNFPHLRKVCQALIEKDAKPKQILREIIKQGETDFSKIFVQFRASAGVYGFGDSQVKRILANINTL